MTLDAMHWVWNHSRSRGNARLALLFVADQVRTTACEVRLSYPDFVAALNAPKSTVKAAVKAAVAGGELEIKEAGKGTRASLYRLPNAVGFIRPSVASGSDSGPLRDQGRSASGSDSGPLGGTSGPELSPLRDQEETASGPDFGPLRGASGPDFGPHSPTTPSKQAGGEPEQPDVDLTYGIPEAARPLVDSMTASGVIVRWPYVGNQWFPILSLINKCGVPALVDYARRTADRTAVDSAKYFMRGWAELPPKPAAGAAVHASRPTHLRAVGQTPEERGIF